MFNRALLLMMMLPVALENCPAPVTFVVPWVKFQAVVAEVVMFAFTFNVPVPILVGLGALFTSPFRLMMPLPTALNVGLLPRVSVPMLSVAPFAAPKKMPVEAELLIVP